MDTKGTRAKLTNQMMNRVFARSNGGQSMEEILMDIAQSSEAPIELKFKAASKVADLIFPRAAAVEVDMEQTVNLTVKEMDARLAQLLGKLPTPVIKSVAEETMEALTSAEEVEED